VLVVEDVVDVVVEVVVEVVIVVLVVVKWWKAWLSSCCSSRWSSWGRSPRRTPPERRRWRSCRRSGPRIHGAVPEADVPCAPGVQDARRGRPVVSGGSAAARVAEQPEAQLVLRPSHRRVEGLVVGDALQLPHVRESQSLWPAKLMALSVATCPVNALAHVYTLSLSWTVPSSETFSHTSHVFRSVTVPSPLST